MVFQLITNLPKSQVARPIIVQGNFKEAYTIEQDQIDLVKMLCALTILSLQGNDQQVEVSKMG
jgi:hypothetical protein